MPTLFEPVQLGRLRLPNRIVMAPMGRGRADRNGTPLPYVADYYAQRATAGLIVSEATCPAPHAAGHPYGVHCHSADDIAAWRTVAAAVHAAGGRMTLQIMHAGRISHPDLYGHIPLAPSPVPAAGRARTWNGPQPYPVPREMSPGDIAGAIDDVVRCAVAAIEAGFDGVEIHGANGYLVHQFLSSTVNRRTDGYGGPPHRRVRFAVDLVEAVASAVGADRTGIRLSPGFGLNDMSEPDAAELYPVLLAALRPVGPAYLHLVHGSDPGLVRAVRDRWEGPIVLNPGTGDLDPDATRAVVAGALAAGFDALSFGKQFLANPDLPHRLAEGIDFNRPDPATFYQGGRQGYLDYPKADVREGDTTSWSFSSTSSR
ncbi:oxidoreductase [Actinoplanes derwentensis]|uniref:N-ethylmaleimide reductase n=1 Tax=Actinoplanes derwentensis TaxID=113562 RepID=A0A1H2D8K3_9ACTN|nr:alkene reductase [Actinoplanes derwentensis]GID89695.1 alkene reductase [Actinoplanes derwentensis]SDT78914.1 N-ethylmaleimide reductase [Actinoplanes derwentensis]